ncbi:Lipase 2 [termite gut metagenome]|uniref:Lipase 2 n=1 Tax=termite gut metagenome TaxID=433724 RepID=A0A5J4SKA4_9ZZZZ
MKKFAFITLLCFTCLVNAQTKYELIKNISYVDSTETDAYGKERCKLDIYYPTNKTGFATVVWFHGGGLENGEKHIFDELKEKGIAVVPVNYRLSPKAKNPAYTEDAAAAVAWVFKNIEKYGGSAGNIFVSGHSAGGYLTLMVGLDKSYLGKHGVDADKIRGLISISGQSNTHYTIRKERNLLIDIPVIDEYAPINKSRENIPPTLLISGDRKLEMLARYEENAHLEVILKSLGNKDVKLYELQGYNHGNVAIPGCFFLLEWINKYGEK